MNSPRQLFRIAGYRPALKRQIAVTRRRGFSSALLLLVPGTLLATVVSEHGLRTGPAVTQVLAVTTTVAALSGAALSYTDLVQERPVLLRAWRAGSSGFAMLLAKVTVYGVLSGALALFMVGLFLLLSQGPTGAFSLPPWLGLFTAWWAIMLSSMGLGLLISSIAPNLEAAVRAGTMLAIFQACLNGALFQLPNYLAISSRVLPARLGLAATAAYTGLSTERRKQGAYVDPMWDHTQIHYWLPLLGMVVIFLIALVGSSLVCEWRWRR